MPIMEKFDLHELVCVKVFGTRPEADVAKSYLIYNNIQAEIFINSPNVYVPNAFPLGARLMVSEKDKEEALKLLAVPR